MCGLMDFCDQEARYSKGDLHKVVVSSNLQQWKSCGASFHLLPAGGFLVDMLTRSMMVPILGIVVQKLPG